MKELLSNWMGSREHLVAYLKKFSDGTEKKALGGGCFSASLVEYVYRKGLKSTYDFYLIKNSIRLSIDSPFMCPLEVEDIEKYLQDINLFLYNPISWEIKDISEKFENNLNVLKLSVSISNAYNTRQHLYILTRVRQIIEVPVCFMLKDAIELKEMFPEKYDSIEHALSDILVTVHDRKDGNYMFGCCNPLYVSNRCSILPRKSLDYSGKNIGILVWQGVETYKERFKEIKRTEYFQTALYKEYEKQDVCKLETANVFDIHYWKTEFERRIPVYLREKSDTEYREYPEEFDYRFKGGDANSVMSGYINTLSRILNDE